MLEAVVVDGDGGVEGARWLRGALEAVHGSGLLGRARRQAIYVAMTVDRQQLTRAACDIMGEHEQIVASVSLWAGRPCGIGGLLRALRAHGLCKLAARVQKMSRTRNAVAHPDATLVSEVAAALRECSSEYAGSEGLEGSGNVPCQEGTTPYLGVERFFIGDVGVYAEGQTEGPYFEKFGEQVIGAGGAVGMTSDLSNADGDSHVSTECTDLCGEVGVLVGGPGRDGELQVSKEAEFNGTCLSGNGASPFVGAHAVDEQGDPEVRASVPPTEQTGGFGSQPYRGPGEAASSFGPEQFGGYLLQDEFFEEQIKEGSGRCDFRSELPRDVPEDQFHKERIKEWSRFCDVLHKVAQNPGGLRYMANDKVMYNLAGNHDIIVDTT
jgi:hypothetical protein